MIGVAYSTWRGENFTHYFRDEGHFMQQRTLCGKSVLGWPKRELEEIRNADCIVCDRAFAKLKERA